MSFVLYLVVSVLARLVASSGDAGSKDIEISSGESGPTAGGGPGPPAD